MEKSAKKRHNTSDSVARISLIGLGLLLFTTTALLYVKTTQLETQLRAVPHAPTVDLQPLRTAISEQNIQVNAIEKRLTSLQHDIAQTTPQEPDKGTLFGIQMAIIELTARHDTQQAGLWLSRIHTADPALQQAITTQQQILSQYHQPNISSRLSTLHELIQYVQGLSIKKTLPSATPQTSESNVVALPAFLDRYLVIRRDHDTRAQYWLDATEQAITSQDIIGALYLAQLALVSQQEADYQQALQQAVQSLRHLHATDKARIEPMITKLQQPLTSSPLPDLYPLYQQAQQTLPTPAKEPVTAKPTHTRTQPTPPSVSEEF